MLVNRGSSQVLVLNVKFGTPKARLLGTDYNGF